MIFSPEQMWQCAVEQMGTRSDSFSGLDMIMLESPQDVAELYKAMQEAHWKAVTHNQGLLDVEDYERKL